jgi:transposase
MKWITRIPATFSDAQAALAPVDPQCLASLTEHYYYGELPSIYGNVPQCWVLIDSELRQTQAQRTVDKQLRQQSAQEGNAWKKLCSTTFGCEADARQALAAFEHILQATFLVTGTLYVMPRDGKRRRPARDTPPDQMVYHIDGALASSLTSRQALLDQHRCFIRATNELDDTHLPPQELLEGCKGQVHAERGSDF